MSDRLWRAVFLTGAVFNWIVGASLMFDTAEFAASAGLEVARYDAFYSPAVGWFIVIFGFLYWAVWRDLENRAIVLIGMVGKLGAVALTWLAFARGLVPFSMAALTLIDVAFAALFATFLLTRRRAGAGS
jgi:hypothetical protein